MKTIQLKTLCLLSLLATASCSDDDSAISPVPPGPGPVLETVFVINQGNYYGGVAGTIDRINMDDSTTVSSCFYAANQQSLGDSPQGAIVYGSRMYIPMYGSNLLWVLDKYTLRIITRVETPSPEDICAADGFVFISNNDGFVSRMDTLTCSIDKRVEVGPNPAQIMASEGKVYVSISDGYNYEGGYANGCRVAVLSSRTGEKISDIPVGVNPGPLAIDGEGNLFVVCRGNYADLLPEVYKVDILTGKSSAFAPGSLIAADGTNLYTVDVQTDWNTYTTTVSYRLYHTQTGQCISEDFLANRLKVPYPTAISTDPLTHTLYICSDKSSADYDKSGYLFVYRPDRTEGQCFDVGIHPCGVAVIHP